MQDELKEIPASTPNFRTELAEKLAELVPEAIADGKIDTKKLEELLDGDAADTRERFGLFWPGKKRALRAAQEPTTATLVPDKENSKDWDETQNVFIEGDNLEALKILQKHYHGKIKMIYIDPPYNTGKDFVYPDNYREGLQSYLEFTRQVDEGGKKLSTNSDQAGRYHSNWLSMMYPRLKLARNLMAPEGLLFISIDEHEIANLLRLVQEVFGEDNVLGAFPVVMNLKGNQDAFGFAETHEYFIACARDKSRCQIGRFPVDEEQVLLEWDQDDYGLYKEADNLRATGVNAPREKRPNLWYPIFIDPKSWEFYVDSDDRPRHPDHEALWPVNPKGQQLSWYWSKNTFEKNKHNLILKTTSNGWQFYRKQRPALGDVPTSKPKSFFFKPSYSTSTATKRLNDLLGGRYFDGPKPVPFLKDLLQIGTAADSIVLDFFSGSGTTAEAVMELNAEDGGTRRHIQVQLPEPVPEDGLAARAGFQTISDIARRRIELAGERILEERRMHLEERSSSLDVGYRTYKLSDTNFAKWQTTSDIAESELEQHLLNMRESADDRASQDALLTELMLKRGYSLTEQVDVLDIAGLEIRGVQDSEGDYGLLAYLNEYQMPTLEQLRALVEAAEAQIIVLEDAFQGDDQLKTNLAQMCKTEGVELWTA